MADTGFRFPTSESLIVGEGGGWGWRSLSNDRADDGVNTDCNVRPNLPLRTSNVYAAENFGFTSTLIPEGSIINSVELQVQWGLPWSQASLGIQAYVSGAAVGSENVETTALYSSPQVRTYNITAQRSWTPADLRDGVLTVRLGAGNSNTTSSTVNFKVDYVAVRVTFTPPTSTGTLTVTEARDTAAMAGKLGIIGAFAATDVKDAAAITGLLSDGSQSVQAYVGGVAVGTIRTNKEPALTDTTFDITAERSWAPADFRDAAFAIHVGSHNDGPPVVSSWDCVSLRVTYAQPPAGEYTGTLAAVEAGDSATIYAEIVASGALSVVEAVDGAAFLAAITGSGALLATEAKDVAAFVGEAKATGTLAATEAKDVAAFTGSIGYEGILAAVETAADVAAFAGTVAHTATLAATELPDVAAFLAVTTLPGILAASELPDVAAFTGSATHAGVLAATEAKDAAAFTGSATHTGTLAATEPRDVAAFAEAELAFVGELIAVEASDTAAFAGGLTASGTLAASEAKDGAALLGGIIATGPLAATEAKDSAAFVATSLNGGILAATEARDTALFIGNARTFGALVVTEPQDRALMISTSGWTGTLAATEARDSAIFGGAAHNLGVLTATEARDSAAFVGKSQTEGVLAATERSDSAVFVQVDVGGIISAIEASDIVVILGNVQDLTIDIIGDEDRPMIQGGCEGRAVIDVCTHRATIKGSV